MDNLELIRDAWGWAGIDPVEVVRVNSFGNLLIRDAANKYWRICPEELSIEIVADDEAAFNSLLEDPDFAEDWTMRVVVQAAEQKLGSLGSGRVYCLKIPGVLGGRYEQSNYGTISIKELIRFAGDVAAQIKDLPDGARVEFKFVD